LVFLKDIIISIQLFKNEASKSSLLRGNQECILNTNLKMNTETVFLKHKKYSKSQTTTPDTQKLQEYSNLEAFFIYCAKITNL